MSESRLFRPRPSYAPTAIGGMVVALLFAWELGQNFAWATLFFFLIALFFTAVNLLSAMSHVEVTPTGLIFYRRFRSPLDMEFRQIVTISEAGRMTSGLSLVYFPSGHNGLIDLDDPRSIFLPGVAHQDELLALVRQRIAE